MGIAPTSQMPLKEDAIRKMGPIIDRVSREKGIAPINLAQGNPVGRIPKEFARHLSNIVLNQAESAQPTCGYCPSSGLPAYLEAMAQYERDHWGLDVTSDNILAVPGAAVGLGMILSTLAKEGKGNVVIPAPFFSAYHAFVGDRGFEIKVAPYSPSERKLLDNIDDTIDEDTRAVLINSPNNPFGRIFSSEFLIGLGDLLKIIQYERDTSGKEDIVLISDQPYRRLVRPGVEVPVVAEVTQYPHTWEVNSWSKEARMAGYRIGHVTISPYEEGPKRVRDILASQMVPSGVIQSSTPLQAALAQCKLPFELDWSENFASMDRFADNLESIGYDVARPDGGLFLCVRKQGVRSDTLNEALMQEAVGSADTQYSGFKPEEGYVRLSFFDVATANNPEAVERFERVYSKI